MTSDVRSELVLSVLSGLMSLFCFGMSVYAATTKDSQGIWAAVWVGFLMGLNSFAAYKRAIRAKRRVAEYLEHFSGLSYERAISEAQESCVSLPRELAERKYRPTGDEWQAFEVKGMQFIIERNEHGPSVSARTI